MSTPQKQETAAYRSHAKHLAAVAGLHVQAVRSGRMAPDRAAVRVFAVLAQGSEALRGKGREEA